MNFRTDLDTNAASLSYEQFLKQIPGKVYATYYDLFRLSKKALVKNGLQLKQKNRQ